MKINLTSLTEFVKFIIAQYVKKSDIVLDATIGNGNDTIFLADLVGVNGKVYGFDIQKEAVDKTIQKLKENRQDSQVKLILDSHENIDKYIKEDISAVMFNLGYLPCSNHNIKTTGKETVTAIEKSLKILKNNGIITIVSYLTHTGGKEENKIIEKYLYSLDEDLFKVIKYGFLNSKKESPFAFIIIKK